MKKKSYYRDIYFKSKNRTKHRTCKKFESKTGLSGVNQFLFGFLIPSLTPAYVKAIKSFC